jgi:hypothetical protein
MILNELYQRSPEAYQDRGTDNSQPQVGRSAQDSPDSAPTQQTAPDERCKNFRIQRKTQTGQKTVCTTSSSSCFVILLS